MLVNDKKSPKPCTPKGSMELIFKGRELLGLDNNLSGLNAVVLGRSILVGKPMASLLLRENCTVSICHSRTKDLSEKIKNADILVAAVGKPGLVKGDDLKKGLIVIDVGINRLDNGKLVGDVDFESAVEVCGAITPVPGGCGPMTIAMLLENTIESAEKTCAKKDLC